MASTQESWTASYPIFRIFFSASAKPEALFVNCLMVNVWTASCDDMCSFGFLMIAGPAALPGLLKAPLAFFDNPSI